GGRVGIGGIIPACTLDIYDPGQAQCRMVSGNALNGAVLELTNNRSGPNNYLGAINFTGVTGTIGQIGYIPASGSDDPISFRGNGNQQMSGFRNRLTQVKTLQRLGRSALAEPFDVAAADQTEPQPGHVVVIDPTNPWLSPDRSSPRSRRARPRPPSRRASHSLTSHPATS